MKKLKALSACLPFLFLFSCAQQQHDNKDKGLETRIDNLLSQMTLEEKIGQMNQISSFGNIEDMSGLIKKGEIGSILNETDPQKINALQRVAMEESRLGIPMIFARDVIHGFKTIFPIPLGQAASFNPEIAEVGARVAAIECSSVGIRWTFAPMIDVARDPRWGRMAEGCGEDTYLTSVMGAAMIKGFQGDSLNNPTSVAACPKHFVGYGAAEGGRDYNSTFIPERLLRNVYLPPFEAAARAGAATYMTSFNDNDGVPSTGNKFILEDVLRKEWGFDGFVVTDWASASEMIPHGFVVDEKDAALKSVNAGVDMEMVSYTFVKYLPELIKEGKVKESTIDNAVRNILRIKFRMGLFENPFVDEEQPSVLYDTPHLEAAKRAAIESAILLKNDKGILPLNGNVKTVAIVGPLADAPHDQMGTWVFDGEKSHTQTPLHAIREMYGDKVQIIYEPGLAYSRDKNTANISKAAAAAAKADVVLAFVGEEAILSGEAHCLADLNLVGAQSELIAALAKTGKPVVTVVMAGRPLTIGKEAELSSAVLYNFHPGTMGGPAIADLLFGKEVPSGKTPVTFPKMVGQVPMYYAHNNSGRPAQKNETLINDIPLEAGQTSLGNTSFYLDAGFDPLYPFGYGLSYTTFEYSDVKIASSQLKKQDVLSISFSLENTGKYKGTEVAQLYVRDKVGSVTRPVKELKRFTRIMLQPGEKKTVTFELPVAELAFWNIDMVKTVEAGDFGLWVAGDSQSGNELVFKVTD
ncbi:glycoside hydrolase family 3 N-terminal domain-containing protein [Bacteroides sp. 519]|uniref:glycoside hydrolase family 3 N-terminal domain-containing protein n=1 Tax=Bacteroides sp. 519 TaxID=2302937 RepID=UPI0013D4967D|nr:glycoside hydrolase family 3 N-terminal domain-containing protein [Bacteroides sp. 519]NDV59120.1 glycosyl hydrolase [Bacteroides sp. 519]